MAVVSGGGGRGGGGGSGIEVASHTYDRIITANLKTARTLLLPLTRTLCVG